MEKNITKTEPNKYFVEIIMPGTEVYWLTSRGFQKGKIIKVRFTQEYNKVISETEASVKGAELIYICKSDYESEAFMGHEKTVYEVFLNKEDMLKYYMDELEEDE